MRDVFAGLLFLFALALPAVAQAPSNDLVARAEAGDANAAVEAAMGYLDANDDANALRFATIAANAGHAEGMNMLAVMLQEADPAAARAWQDRALAAGSDGARLNRGLQLLFEASSDADWDAGMTMLRAVQSDQIGPVLDELSQQYERFTNATPARAFQFTQLAAERGAAPAQWRFAMRLLDGDGGPRDVAAAYQWTRRSAEGGYVQGMISTAVMLATGEGVAENDVEARAWYQRAADTGSVHALRGLGGMYLSGEGGPADLARGWAYLTLAADAGDEIAQRVRPQFEQQITQDARVAAEAIRTEWRAAHPAGP